MSATGAEAEAGTRPGGGPLTGIRVIDLTMFISGPVATLVLADLGAEVIKVEPVTGDPVRANAVGPRIDGESAQFHSYNRNKRSVAVDLKRAEGVALVQDLCATADVVIDNYRPGVLERLGLDHATVRRRAPRLVGCSISAFGQTGPWRQRPGFDLVVQALSGAMSLTGHLETGPSHIPGHLGDTASGLYAAIGILAALNERDRTGVGRSVDVALLDSIIAILGDEITHLGAGLAPTPHRGGHPLFFPYEAFPTRDEPMVIAAVGVERFWPALCEAIGRRDLAADPRFASNDGRVSHRDHLYREISAVLRTRSREEWLAILEAADVPATPVNTLSDVVDHPQVKARRMVVEIRRPEGVGASLAGNPIKVSGHDQSYAPSPTLGADTSEVLERVLGLAPEAVDRLRRNGIVG
jgi:crotonobetainyl-CoA:carnitine CoA-transferase CaiB-like acyl-CoA transferase